VDGGLHQPPGSRLRRLQRELEALYDLPLGPDVEQFVCDEGHARAIAGDAITARREALIVVEHGDEVEVGLYVDPALRTPHSRFDAVCVLAEGVSHFVYLEFRSCRGREVSELELELQAEVDKYALALVRDPSERLPSRSRRLRRRLFEDAAFLDPQGSERGERYRLATKMASAYARSLERRYGDAGDLSSMARELRRFYRLGEREKLAHVARAA
jgi:hypothetical protein